MGDQELCHVAGKQVVAIAGNHMASPRDFNVLRPRCDSTECLGILLGHDLALGAADI